MIQLSPAAVSEVKRLRLKQVSSHTGRLRIRVEKSGCAGFSLQYKMEFETDSSVEDQVFPSDDLDVVMDSQTLPYVKDLLIDFTEDLMGGAFCFQNPLAGEVCNCGTSFNISNTAPK
ncbi:MAG: iron-sulfur cluster assembly accessory protein [Cyanobacteria bacterium P01_F01_bin.42]